VVEASQNINTFFESLPQGNETVLQLFMQQQLQQMLPRESKVACVRESTVRDHLGEGVSCVCASSKLDLAFKNDQCYLPFFIEMKTTVFHALPNYPEEIENFPASVWKHLRQTLVYALSAQAFSHRVRFGNNTDMRCALLFPSMLFMIRLSPLENDMKWDVTVNLFDTPQLIGACIAEYVNDIVTFSRNNSPCVQPLSWVPMSTIFQPFTKTATRGFMYTFRDTADGNARENFLRGFFTMNPESLELALQQDLILKHVSALLDAGASGNLTALQLLINNPHICTPYLGVHVCLNIVLMKNVGESLPCSEIFNVWHHSKLEFMQDVCVCALAATRAGLCHNDIRPANITIQSTQDGTVIKFFLVDWDNARRAAFIPGIKDGRYPAVRRDLGMEVVPLYFTALQLLNVIFCIDETVNVLSTDTNRDHPPQVMNSLERNIQQFPYPCQRLIDWATSNSTSSFILYACGKSCSHESAAVTPYDECVAVLQTALGI